MREAAASSVEDRSQSPEAAAEVHKVVIRGKRNQNPNFRGQRGSYHGGRGGSAGRGQYQGSRGH